MRICDSKKVLSFKSYTHKIYTYVKRKGIVLSRMAETDCERELGNLQSFSQGSVFAYVRCVN